MKIGDVFPSEFLKSSDLGGNEAQKQFKVKIQDVRVWQDPQGGRKLSLGFVNSEKRLLANITNTRTIAKVFGEETDVWLGKIIVLYVALVDFKGEQVEGIRVRVPSVSAHAAKSPKPAPQPASPSPVPASDASHDATGDFRAPLDDRPEVDSLDAFGLPQRSNDMDDEIPF